jgi:hypothetical protein
VLPVPYGRPWPLALFLAERQLTVSAGAGDGVKKGMAFSNLNQTEFEAYAQPIADR